MIKYRNGKINTVTLMTMNATEARSTAIVGTILATRLLGIFLILPVFSSYALLYPGSSHFLAGLAFGVYALAQAAFQIPFGRASDRFGRKPVIVFGLALFCAGSVWCGIADNIWQLIAARTLQGSGAVGSVAIAALGDFTRPEVRAQSFAATGLIIGGVFMLSLVAGPVLAVWLGFENLFFVLAVLGITAIAITLLLLPHQRSSEAKQRHGSLAPLLRNGEIKKILASAFVLSSILNIFLFVYPLIWNSADGGRISQIWTAYLIVLLPAALLAYPFLKIMERKKKMNVPPMVAVLLLALGTAIAFAGGEKSVLIAAGAVFFLGHSIFQPILPAFLTQTVSDSSRGSVSGFLNLASFLGAFAGSMLAGLSYAAGAVAPLTVCLFLIVLWTLLGIPRSPMQEGKNG